MTLQEFLKVAYISEIYLDWDYKRDWRAVYEDEETNEITLRYIDSETSEEKEETADPTKIEIRCIQVLDPNNSVLLLVKDI